MLLVSSKDPQPSPKPKDLYLHFLLGVWWFSRFPFRSELTFVGSVGWDLTSFFYMRTSSRPAHLSTAPLSGLGTLWTLSCPQAGGFISGPSILFRWSVHPYGCSTLLRFLQLEIWKCKPVHHCPFSRRSALWARCHPTSPRGLAFPFPRKGLLEFDRNCTESAASGISLLTESSCPRTWVLSIFFRAWNCFIIFPFRLFNAGIKT